MLSNAHHTFLTALNSPSADSSNCATVNCFNVTSLPDMNAFAAFGRTLRATPVPPGPAAIAKRLMADTAGSEQDYKEITEATSFDSIVNIATAAEQVGGQFDNDYSALMTSLDNAGAALGDQAGTLNNAATPLTTRPRP